MLSKTSFLSVIISFTYFSVFGQITDLAEKKPVTFDGVEYGYLIRNEQIKSAKGEEYSRYEIALYATNKSGCTKLYADRNTFRTDDYPNLLATFICSNANGKRLTAKNGAVKVRDFYVNVKENSKDAGHSVKAGYMFRNNETIKTNIIVLVPKDERPLMQCTVNNLQEL